MTAPLLLADFPKTFTAETHPELSLAGRRGGTRLIMLAEVAGLEVFGARTVMEGDKVEALEVDIETARGTFYMRAVPTRDRHGRWDYGWAFGWGGAGGGVQEGLEALDRMFGRFVGHLGADAAHNYDQGEGDWTVLAIACGFPQEPEALKLRQELMRAWGKARETAQAA